MATLRLSLLPGFKASLGDAPITHFRSTKTQALLAYLCVEAERPHRREALAGLFWPDQPDQVARHNISQALIQLRAALGAPGAGSPFVLTTRQAVQWNSDADYTLDVREFSAELAAWQSHPHTDSQLCPECVQRLRRAVDGYGGPFLDGFTLYDCDAFVEWALLKREWFQQQALGALGQLADYHEWRGEYNQTQRYAQRQAALDPLAEPAHRQMMRALALDGQHSAALAHFEEYRRMVQATLGIDPAPETLALQRQILASELTPARPAPSGALDWSDVPTPGSFYGRDAELATMQHWTLDERHQVVAVVGLGGIGKTALAAQFCRAVAPHFAAVLWCSLLNAPPLEQVLRDCLHDLSAERHATLPATLDEQLGLLLDELRRRRCLLVLDNLESLLSEGERAGQFRSGYADYGQFLQRLGQRQHQSCLLLTSRERPLELARLERERRAVRTLHLDGLDATAGQALLRAHDLDEHGAAATTLVQHYSGNPLALQLVAEAIRELFAGDVSAFLRDERPIFDDIRDVLDQQFARLTPLERELLFWLAIEREPLRIEELEANLAQAGQRRDVLEALRSIQRRSLLEQRDGGFALQNVIIEYLTARLIAQACVELDTEAPSLLARHALIKAQAPEYVRQIQTRLILDPVARHIVSQLGATGAAARCKRLLTAQRATPRAASYVAGNLLNLLLHIGHDLRGYDFSRLSVWQAFLRGRHAPGINFANADLRGAAFTDSFSIMFWLAFSPDGDTLAAATGDGNVRLFQVADGRLARTFTGPPGIVWSATWSPDGHMLATAHVDHLVRVWDVASGDLVKTLRGHAQAVNAVAWSPAGDRLASGGDDNSVCVWETGSWNRRAFLTDCPKNIHELAWNPASTTLALRCGPIVQLWEPGGAPPKTLLAADHAPVSLAWSPDGSLLATGGYEGDIWLRDTHHDRAVFVFKGPSSPSYSLAWKPDDKVLACGYYDGTVQLWDVERREVARVFSGHTGYIRAVAWSPDGARLASSGEDKTVRVWQAGSGELLLTLQGYTRWTRFVAFSPTGQLVAAYQDGAVRVWDLTLGVCQRIMRGHSAEIYCVAASADGALIASCSNDGTVRLWDAASGNSIYALHTYNNEVLVVAFSPDGATLAGACSNGSVRLWDTRSGDVLAELEGHENGATGVAWSPDGTRLASTGYDYTLRVWDVATRSNSHALRAPGSVGFDVAWSPDGSRLATCWREGSVQLWDAASGSALATLRGHIGRVWRLAWSHDSARLASAGADETVCVWEASSGQLIHTLRGHTRWVGAVAWAQGDRTLASGSYDETIRLWDTTTGACLTTLRAPGPYEGMNISGATGLSHAQRNALVALGAVEEHAIGR